MQQYPLTSSTHSGSSTVGPSTVPQFVVIYDQMQQSWKHPVVHYVFEDEPFPLIAQKDRCVLVDLKEDGESVADCHSLSHTFQVTDCKVSLTPQMNAAGQGGKEPSSATGLMLTIEGISNSKSIRSRGNQLGFRDEFDQSSSIFGLDGLVYDYKRRNDLMRQLFSKDTP
ncbi:6761_t:CDS:2 [Acaulospora morrowiae]|uniref:6761_t:CDS:1 n=1 Tax=Acaulospora morrowiae TaxID=94023 RepID=A0A9N9A4Z8_9GLOM|nr:6761_t:CDS:2 [Acaulospora morrowiae]